MVERAAQIGIAFIGIGFLVLFVAWNGAAEQDCPECQIPYLLSGGAVGLGLIIVGAALLLFESARRDRLHIEAKLDEIRQALEQGVPSTNGRADLTAPVPAIEVPTDPNAIVLGRSSYHRPDCRLVSGKGDLEYGTRADATARNLEACRVCEPAITRPAGRKR